MSRLSVLIGVVSLLLLTGCDYFQKNSKEVVVAECYGKYLYESDLKGIVPEGASIMDSIQRASSFIDSWIKKQVLVHQAETNLSKEELLKHYQYDRKEKSNLMKARRLLERIDILADDFVLTGDNMRRRTQV